MAQTATKPERATPPAPAPAPRTRTAGRRIALRVLADALAVSAALFLASAIRFELLEGAPAARFDYTSITIVATGVWIVLFWLYGLYEPRQVLGPVNEFKQVFHGVVAGTAAIFIADSVFTLNLARQWALLALLCGMLFVGGERLVVRKVLHFLRRRGGDTTRTIVLGTNHEARTVAKTLQREAWLGYQIVGFVDDAAPAGHELAEGQVVLGGTAELKELIRKHRAGLVLVAATAFDTGRLNRLFWELQDADVDLQITSGTIDLMASRMIVQSVAGVPLIYVRKTGMDKIQRTIKRSLDVVGALAGLLVLSPVLAGIALWIRRDSPGGPFFGQIRSGRDGELFKCWKFRTMFEDAEARRAELEHLNEGPGLLFKLADDPRVTKAGKVLRRYSFDELPQLWNVLRGEMSLVGPRPTLRYQVEQYDERQRHRLDVKSGITGWA